MRIAKEMRAKLGKMDSKDINRFVIGLLMKLNPDYDATVPCFPLTFCLGLSL